MALRSACAANMKNWIGAAAMAIGRSTCGCE
jgi:hypothetical protein